MRDRTYFDTIQTEPQAYWLGFLLADGCLFRNGKQVAVLLGIRDRSHLGQLAALFDRPVREHRGYDRRTGKTYEGVRLVLNSKHLWDALATKGFAP